MIADSIDWGTLLKTWIIWHWLKILRIFLKRKRLSERCLISSWWLKGSWSIKIWLAVLREYTTLTLCPHMHYIVCYLCSNLSLLILYLNENDTIGACDYIIIIYYWTDQGPHYWLPVKKNYSHFILYKRVNLQLTVLYYLEVLESNHST